MDQTNPSEAAAASSPDRLQVSDLPDERALQYIAQNELGYFPSTMQAMAREILRMWRDCPSTAEVEQMRAGASEANSLRLHLSNIDEALFKAGKPQTRTRGDELERIRDLAGDRDAWKHKADTLGGDLNRIRALVPFASDEQTTFDVVQAYLETIGKERRDLAVERDKLRNLIAAADCEFLRAGTVPLDGKTVPVDVAMRELANVVAGLRSSGFREAVMLFDGFLRRCGINVSKLEGLMPVQWVIAAAKLLQKGAAAYEPALPAEAQTAIAAMRDVGPELAKAGIQVGPRCSHAEAVAQLRGERDRWRERCEAANQRVDALERFEGAVVADLAKHGFFATSNLNGVLHAIGDAFAELTRLRKESKRDRAEKQQALLDEIARLVPGKGTLIERVRRAAKVEHHCWRERFMRLRDSIKVQIAWCCTPSGTPHPAMPAEHRVLSCALKNAEAMLCEASGDRASLPSLPAKEGPLPGSFCGTNQPELPPLKVGPATGQPRTEVPLAADGSGTVVELGEPFRQNLSNAVACLPDGAIDPTTIKIAIRNLHACVAELAKVVERIGAR